MSDGFRRNSEQDRLSKLGCRILAHDPLQGESSYSRCVWEYLLPQLSHAIPTVNAAAAAFGAFYELRVMPEADRLHSTATKQYEIALLNLQQDISNQPHGSVALLLACVMLASAELMQRRQLNALIHLQGAFKILSASGRTRSSPTSSHEVEQILTPGSTGADSNSLTNDDVSLLFEALDVQTAGYVLGRPPDLPTSVFDRAGNRSEKLGSVNEAEARLVPLLHSCYHFTAHATAFKYLPHAPNASVLLLEQGRHLAHLSQWLEILDRNVLSVQPGAVQQLATKSYSHALMLRAQCLGNLVYASTVLSPYEASYDLHTSRFTQIVEDVATALTNHPDTMADIHQFRPGPGILQALFFTAIKCRHSALRRHAVDLLRRAGLEGPWDGKLLAAVASRAIEIEEENLRLSVSQVLDVLPEHISERDRLHGCGIDSEAAPGKPMHTVTVAFSRCRDVERMVSGELPWDDKSNWEMWDETLLF